MTRRVGAVLALAGLASALALLLAEGVLRGYAAWADTRLAQALTVRDPLAVTRVPHGEYGYRQRPSTMQAYPNGAVAGSNALGFRGPEVAREKPAGTYRIILLGGSATHGWGVNDDETIDAAMRDALDAELGGPRVEVINLALDGYDSAQAFERMRSDGVGLQPDLVIVNSGVNDVRNAQIPDLETHPDPRTSIWELSMAQMRAEQLRGGPAPWTLMKHYSFAARLPGIYRDFTRGEQGQRLGRIEPHDGAVEYFEQSLQKIWEMTRDGGGALLLSTPPSSLETRYAPDDVSDSGYWINDAATTAAYRLRLANRMREMASRLAAEGHPVRHAAHELPPEMFFDDCHLTVAGNQRLGRALAADASAFIASARSRD
jgi:lysophospholipase L1-like esterase